jgi:hypothetical protein
VKLPPSSEARALRAATPAEPEALAQLVRSGLTDWVRAMVSGATAELESSALRHAVAGDRSHTATALALLQGRRELVVDRLAHGIASRIDAAPPGRPTARVAADEAGELKLTLIDEAQIDEDIEIARIVQAIEAEADGELQQLAALASGLRGLPGIDFAALPLRPLACASGLRAGLVELAPDPGTRLLLLRQLGSAMGHELRRVARDLSNTLLGWGVQPAQYRVKHTAAPPAPTSNARRREDAVQPAASTAPPAVDASAALWRLVERARQTLAAETPLAAPTASANALPAADEALTLRLFADPLPAERTRAPLEPGAAAELMERLFAQIEQHLGTTPAARSLLSGLYAPGRALAAHEPQLWTSLDHPWWKLLDRLIAMGSVHGSTDEGADGPAAGAVTQSLGLVMRSLRQSPAPSRLTLQAAADEVQQLATRAMDERTSTLQGQLGDIQRQADRDEVEVELREQIVQQLRSSPVCPGLRQFLVGPWTQAMTAVTLQHGLHCAQMGGLALVVDDLIRATARPGQRVSRAQRAVLLRQVSEGLAHAGLPPSRNDAEMADLQALLENPPPVQEERWEDPVDSGPAPLVLELQAGLPTVPIAMGPGIDTTLEVAGHKPWLDELAPGAYCRLFLLGRWMTAQLTWVSDSHNLYLFSSRHGGRTHSLTRRMLGKLRAAGLATSVEDGALLAQAMDQLADTGFSAP